MISELFFWYRQFERRGSASRCTIAILTSLYWSLHARLSFSLLLFLWGRGESTRSNDDYVTTAPKREPGRRRLISIVERVDVAARAKTTATTTTTTMDFVLWPCQNNGEAIAVVRPSLKTERYERRMTWIFKQPQFADGYGLPIVPFTVACRRISAYTSRIGGRLRISRQRTYFVSAETLLHMWKGSLVVARRYKRKYNSRKMQAALNKFIWPENVCWDYLFWVPEEIVFIKFDLYYVNIFSIM